MTQFFAMGGYAAYVWSAYGVTALGLGAAVALSLRAYFRAKGMSANPGDRIKE
jgi:heme exporter protein CcmD